MADIPNHEEDNFLHLFSCHSDDEKVDNKKNRQLLEIDQWKTFQIKNLPRLFGMLSI